MEFTRERVLELIQHLLDSPDVLIDAVQNENTNHDAESLFKFAEGFLFLDWYESFTEYLYEKGHSRPIDQDLAKSDYEKGLSARVAANLVLSES